MNTREYILAGNYKMLDALFESERRGWAVAKTLAHALRALHDEQNGPPLETSATEWKLAYDSASKALSEFEPIIERRAK